MAGEVIEEPEHIHLCCDISDKLGQLLGYLSKNPSVADSKVKADVELLWRRSIRAQHAALDEYNRQKRSTEKPSETP
jgi:hypothetical protein